MNRVKISEYIAIINGICIAAIVLGIFLPFAKIELWGYDLIKLSIFEFITDSDIKELLKEAGYYSDATTYVAIFIIALIASVAGGINFKTNLNITPTIVMIIAAFVGKSMFGEITDALFSSGYVQSLSGSTFITWGYKIMLLDSFAAFAVNFYLSYIAQGNSQLATTVKKLSAQTGRDSNSGIVCPSCGTHNSSGNRFCSGCGKELPSTQETQTTREVQQSSTSSTWFCTKCGCENTANARFCEKCGASKH